MEAPRTLQEAVIYFADPENCHAFMVSLRWPDGVVRCPTCNSDKVTYLQNARLWKCYGKHDRPKFSLKTGTIFEDSPLSLSKWLPAVWLIVNCRNGVSSHELGRTVGVTQKTAWFMLHRIRLAMQDDLTGGNLGGEVEVDETFIGGKARNMHKDRKRRVQMHGRNTGGKAIVLGMLERKTEGKAKRIRATVIKDRTRASIAPEVQSAVEKGSTIHSDEHGTQWRMEDYEHNVVNHAEAYVKDNVHTNGLENFWSLLKRGIGGTYVSVEPFHLFRYIDEQAFRFNNRLDVDGLKIPDSERFRTALSQVVGRRLTYEALIGKEAETASEEAAG
ncbi:MAG: IS1595 family transposase [Bryobacteraceae bacterium]|nr:IS1595 family transposase [Bryobacteraceae bacterium]